MRACTIKIWPPDADTRLCRYSHYGNYTKMIVVQLNLVYDIMIVLRHILNISSLRLASGISCPVVGMHMLMQLVKLRGANTWMAVAAQQGAIFSFDQRQQDLRMAMHFFAILHA